MFRYFIIFLCSFAPISGFAGDSWPLASFCSSAQQFVAGTQLDVDNTVHTDYQAFVESKPTTEPLESQQFVTYTEIPGDSKSIPQLISCKLKTKDLIREVYGDVTVGKEKSCRDIHQFLVENVRRRLGKKSMYSVVIFDANDNAYMGPQWLKPWPYVPAYQIAGELHLRAKSMYIPFAWYIPMPAKYKGTHYCHLASEAYIEALLRGQLSAVEGES